jgi:acyl carrier protein
MGSVAMNDAYNAASPIGGELSAAELSYIDGGVTAAVRKVKPSLAATTIEAKTRFDDLGISSLEFITIIFEIEDFFNIQIVDRNLDGFKTYGEACKIVGGLIAAKQSANGGTAA